MFMTGRQGRDYGAPFVTSRILWKAVLAEKHYLSLMINGLSLMTIHLSLMINELSLMIDTSICH